MKFMKFAHTQNMNFCEDQLVLKDPALWFIYFQSNELSKVSVGNFSLCEVSYRERLLTERGFPVKL